MQGRSVTDEEQHVSDESPSPRRRVILVAALVVLAVVAAVVGYQVTRDDGGGGGTASSSSTTRAPLGLDFYEASDAQIADGEPGSLVWSREASGATGTEGATTHQVLYRSVGADEEPVAVSGLVTIPDGEPPEGGWPVLSWGHGTTGTADDCAPSRGAMQGTGSFYSRLMSQVTGEYVRRGYVVVATDYEGLGTPGPHPYLMGASAGRAMTDIVTAAGELDEGVSERWLAAGHSQGGQAALFAGAVGPEHAPDLDLQGVVGIAPPSQLTEAFDSGQAAEMDAGVFAGPLVSSAARVAGVEPEEVLTPEAVELLPQLEERCLDGLSEEDSFGGLSVSEVVREGDSYEDVAEVVQENDTASIVPSVPVLVVQGDQDTTVPTELTDSLVEIYEDEDVDVTYELVEGADHGSVLLEAAQPTTEWAQETLPELP